MRWGIILVIVVQLIVFSLALFIIREQKLLARDSATIAYNLSPEGRWHNALISGQNIWATASTAVSNFFTGSDNRPNTQEIEAMRNLVANIAVYQERSQQASWGLAALILLMSGLALALGKLRLLSLHLLLSSLALFMVGVVTVMVFITVSAELWLIGDIVWQHDGKSLLKTVQSLWHNDTWLAIVIALFSIVLPLFKFVVTLSAFFSSRTQAQKRLGYMQHIGKWSMADVFALGTVISFFTFNRLRMTEASLGIGIYFFVAYVFVSMLATWLLARSLRRSY